jgi:hypothetical protein
MKIGYELQKKLSKIYEPSSTIDTVFKRYDITFVTNKQGEPVVLFIGERKENGNIKGGRFTRTLVRSESGELIRDHWDFKGKTH